MKPTILALVVSVSDSLVNAVPMGGSLKKLNGEVCARAAACGHHMDCTQLWLSCNLKLLVEGKGGFTEDGVS